MPVLAWSSKVRAELAGVICCLKNLPTGRVEPAHLVLELVKTFKRGLQKNTTVICSCSFFLWAVLWELGLGLALHPFPLPNNQHGESIAPSGQEGLLFCVQIQ